MDIICWNVAGIRSLIKKGALDFLIDSKFDVLCLQETKALESQVDIPLELKERFPYRYWGENHGLTQRKGLSGTAIWSRIKPLRHLSTPDFDTEGRINIFGQDISSNIKILIFTIPSSIKIPLLVFSM